ncbi:hypothetical protein FGIG_02248 [Fasciola gigantica]|uniref:Uncharacterized protein n=1 Tax=Fasciola gigantica TaxID=46835 RepID=A0A504YK78_FASGI|nr:hypothetical protein FGIG_02248 [Fasciola gigantica]
MPTSKLAIPSATLESGVEISRWNPRLPDNQVTVDLLFTRLRGLIATPTSGYMVTWTGCIHEPDLILLPNFLYGHITGNRFLN